MQRSHWVTSLEVIFQIRCSFLWSHERLNKYQLEFKNKYILRVFVSRVFTPSVSAADGGWDQESGSDRSCLLFSSTQFLLLLAEPPPQEEVAGGEKCLLVEMEVMEALHSRVSLCWDWRRAAELQPFHQPSQFSSEYSSTSKTYLHFLCRVDKTAIDLFQEKKKNALTL